MTTCSRSRTDSNQKTPWVPGSGVALSRTRSHVPQLATRDENGHLKRPDAIGCRPSGRAPELRACGSYTSRDGSVCAHTLAAAAIIGWLGLGLFTACTDGGRAFGTDHGAHDRRD